MTRARLTIRVRLTLLYTGLFATCGAIVVAITYGLVASLPIAAYHSTSTDPDYAAQLRTKCRTLLQLPNLGEGVRAECQRAFEDGLAAGAQNQRDATLEHLLRYSLITLVAVTILAAIAGWIVAGRVLRPVHQIAGAARAASERNLSARVSLTGPRDELRELADTFDDMLDRLQTAFEGQRRFIANASHELRTPLTVMRATVDVVLAKPTASPTELRRMARDIRVAVDHAESLVAALLTLARSERGLTAHTDVDLATIAEDVLDSLATVEQQVQASLQPAATSGDPVLLERLVANLVDNALRYNVSDGLVWIRTGTLDRRATLVVTNTGPQIDPEAIAALFEPFRRLDGRTTTDGHGLGLAIVASIAAAHDATVTAQPMPHGGLMITVTMESTATIDGPAADRTP
ncbi:sensor histidine kinase [Plantactinospora solaniradicis]|uniref:histidine kinase n=1 Tax=Plantactinospora solaniradicis TaxID=1723736 RepID=A0ABW1K6A3_9ACTN